jgi:hypothetical protein
MASLDSVGGALHATTVETTPNAIATRANFTPFAAIQAATPEERACDASSVVVVIVVADCVLSAAVRVVTESHYFKRCATASRRDFVA